MSGISRNAKKRSRNAAGRPSACYRVCELEKIIEHRWPWPGCIPPTPDGRDAVAIMARHCGALGDVGRFVGFVRARVKWPLDIDALLEREGAKAPCDADGAAWRLKLSAADRRRLKIHTISEVGTNRRQRAKRRKNASRIRSAEYRRAAGATPREQSLVRTEPWKTLGMSRATWYRRGKPAPGEVGETNSNAVPSIFLAHEVVSTPVLKSPPQAPPEATHRAESSGEKAISAPRSLPTNAFGMKAVLSSYHHDIESRSQAMVTFLRAAARAFEAQHGRAPNAVECSALLDNQFDRRPKSQHRANQGGANHDR